MEAIVLFWLISPVCAAKVADSKGRSGTGWLIAGLLVGPFALLAACGAGDQISQRRLTRIAELLEQQQEGEQ